MIFVNLPVILLSKSVKGNYNLSDEKMISFRAVIPRKYPAFYLKNAFSK